MKPKLSVSFSGGRTSGYMTRMIQQRLSDQYDIMYLFANTGAEHPKTLEFVRQCDEAWNLDLVWLEAKVNPEMGKGIRWNRVTYETASRNAEPFEAIISKLGVPNKARPYCTRDLKVRPIERYLKDHGWADATSAIGIRADEMDRMSPNAEAQRVVYPLVQWWPTDKQQVLDWWAKQPFDLQIEEHYGNCVWCWKKSLRKLLTLAQDDPAIFDFPKRMEAEHGNTGTLAKKTGEAQVMFRETRSALDLLKMAEKGDFRRYTPDLRQLPMFTAPDPLDVGGDCEESCEIYTEAYYRQNEA